MTEPVPSGTDTAAGSASDDRPASAAGYAQRLELATRGLLELSISVLGRMEGKISPSHLRALQLLDHLGGAKVSALADALGVPPSTASRMSDRLSEAGLLTRQVAPDNRRATWLELTADGRAILAELVEARTSELGRIAAAMSTSDQRALLTGAESFAHAYAQATDDDAAQRGSVRSTT